MKLELKENMYGRTIDGYITGCMFKDNYYIFHIPKGSIKYDYDLQ